MSALRHRASLGLDPEPHIRNVRTLTPPPPSARSYSASQRHALEADIRREEPATCPVCDVRMDIRSVPPRTDVSYVRDRVWLTCSSCGRSLVVDRRES